MRPSNQTPKTTDLTPEKQFLRGPAFLVLGLGFLAMYLCVLPAGIIGAACLILPLALILEPLGERIPILKDYLGGSPLMLWAQVPDVNLFNRAGLPAVPFSTDWK